MTQEKQMQLIRLICLVIPIIILGYIALSTNHKQNSGTLWRVDITGYDPRDLLHGRYIRYQIDWAKYGAVTTTRASTKTLCLNKAPEGGIEPIISLDTAANCASTIYAGKTAKNWNYQGRRYQIPEKYADALDKAFADRKNKFSIDIRVHQNKLYVGDLYMNGKAVKDNYHDIQNQYIESLGTKFVPQEFTLAVKNLRPYQVTDSQACVAYEIDWAKHGLNIDISEQTPNLCLTHNKDGRVIAAAAQDGTQNCTARLRSGAWNSAWNYPFKTFCRNNRHGKFLLDQYKKDPTAFTARIETNAQENLYVKELIIDGTPFNDAFNSFFSKQ